MNKNTLLLLNVLTSPTTVLTEGQMFGALELSGLVKNPDALRAMRFAGSLPSATTPTTLLGFVGVLQSLAQLHPDYTPDASAKLEAYVNQVLSTGTNVPLTFGILLPLLGSLSSASPVRTKPKAAAAPLRTRGVRKKRT